MSGAVTFRLRQVHYDAIASGHKHGEIRRSTPFWRRVAKRDPKIAVFVAPSRPTIRRRISSSFEVPSAEAALGRKLRKGELGDLGAGKVILFVLGEELYAGAYCIRCGCTEDNACKREVDSEGGLVAEQTCAWKRGPRGVGPICTFCDPTAAAAAGKE